MEKYKLIKGETEEDIWKQVQDDLETITYPFLYGASIQKEDSTVFINIEVDLGGGFESGFQSTSLSAAVPIQFTTFSSRIDADKNFRFALHDEDFIDRLGKAFGMEDVETGYEEFDKKLIVKTNDVETVRKVFSDEDTRKLFESLHGFNLHIAYYDDEDKHTSLELTIDREITNASELRRIYNAFCMVLKELRTATFKDQGL